MTQPRKYLWIHLLVLLVVISVVIFGFFSIFLNHCTKQKLEQQCTFFLFINDVYTCIFVFKKIAHKKKHVTHVFATIRLTQLSALRMEKSADWSQKGAAGR